MTNARASFFPELSTASRVGAGSRRLAFMLAIVAIALGQSFVDMARLAASSSSHHHALLALPLAAWLAARDRGARTIPACSDNLGVAALAISLMIWIVGRAGSVALIEHTGAVSALVSATIAAYGRARAAAWAPAFFLMAFAVPFGDELTPVLQELSADIVETLLRAASVPATRDGLIFSTPVGSFEIAESCAGLRFLAAALMMSTLTAALFLQTTWKRLAFVAVAAMLALAANWLRAAAIIAGAVASERRFGVGVDHLYFGWVIYVALLGALILLAYKFRERPIARSSVPKQQEATGVVVGFLIVTAIAAVYLALLEWRARYVSAEFDLAPAVATGWRLTSAQEDWRATATGADKRALWGYWSEHGTVRIDAASFNRDRKGAEIAGWGVRSADGEQWRRVGSVNLGWHQAPDGVTRADILANDAGDRLYVVTSYWTGIEARHSKVDVKLRATLMRLAGQPTDGGAIFIASPSLAALDAFLDDMEPLSLWAAKHRARPRP